MQIEGIQTRAHDVPGVRRKLPEPFMRNVIDLDGGSRVKRSWRDVKILDIVAGDVVANFGKIDATSEIMNVPTSKEILLEGKQVIWKVRLYNVMGEYQDFPAEQRVYAFCSDKVSE